MVHFLWRIPTVHSDTTFDSLPDARRDSYAVPERHREIARLKALGYTNTAIAETMSMSVAGVQNVLSVDAVRDQVATLQEGRDEATKDITERIQGMCGDAVEYMERIVKNDIEVSHSLKFKVAESILDRAGHGKIQKNLFFGATAHLTADDVEELKERARAAGVMI
jgi:hypothetical protein